MQKTSAGSCFSVPLWKKDVLNDLGSKSKGSYIDSKEFRAFKSGLFRFDWNQDYDVLYFKDDEECKDAIMKDISQGIEIFRRVPEWN